jgi:hypothetical protein
MSISSYLETLPLNKIAKYTEGSPKKGVAFIGYPRQHPSEKHKLILIFDPLGQNPKVLEFKFEDVLLIEEVPSAITQSGEGIPLVKLWVRRGAHGVILEPFEVNEPVRFGNNTGDFEASLSKQRPVLGDQP